MFRTQLIRQASRAVALPRPIPIAKGTPNPEPSHSLMRHLSSTPRRYEEEEDKYRLSSTAAPHGTTAEHEGSYARTDNQVKVEYPKEHEIPRSRMIQGRGGIHSRGHCHLSRSKALVASGANLAIVDLNKEEGAHQAEELVRHFKEENSGAEAIPKVTAHYADVANPDSVNDVLAEVLSVHGKVDNLVTSAGFTENFDAIQYPYDRMKKLWGVNVDGTYLFAIGVAKHLMERKAPGSIVMIGSMSGAIVNVPQPQAPYNAAKAAIRHLAASLAVEWAHAGIRVNCISPGYMLTALTRKILDDNPDLNKRWTSLIPQGKMGRPEDLMGAVTFLLSDASGYVTGADLRVDGGYTTT